MDTIDEGVHQMSTDTKTFQIFVGSPGDVTDARKQAFDIIKRLNGDPLLTDGFSVDAVGWDVTPYANTSWLSPQKAIDTNLPRPSECDIAVFILWSRIGTPLREEDYPPETRPQELDRAPTGTEWEFFNAMDSAEEKGVPVVLTFRCTRKQTIDTDDEEEEDSLLWQRREVRGFFKRFKDDQGGYRWSVNEYADSEEFAHKLDSQLRAAIKSLTAGGPTAPKPAPKKVGPQVPSHYLRWLREEDTRIPLLGLDPKKTHTARLPQVYVPALTEARVSYNQGYVRALVNLLKKKARDKWVSDDQEYLQKFVKSIDAFGRVAWDDEEFVRTLVEAIAENAWDDPTFVRALVDKVPDRVTEEKALQKKKVDDQQLDDKDFVKIVIEKLAKAKARDPNFDTKLIEEIKNKEITKKTSYDKKLVELLSKAIDRDAISKKLKDDRRFTQSLVESMWKKAPEVKEELKRKIDENPLNERLYLQLFASVLKEVSSPRNPDVNHSSLLFRLNVESLYVPGEPGSGKSVFCRWVAWVVAAGRMANASEEEPVAVRETLPRLLLGRLPLLVRLREFHGYVDCGSDAGHFSRTQLEKALAVWVEAKRPGELRSEVFQRNLEAGNCLLLLDGMDEVPISTEQDGILIYPRQALLTGLADALPQWHESGNRILLTSRPYGLDPEDTRALNFSEATLAPLSESLQELFVTRWFTAVDPKEADKNISGLLDQLAKRPELKEFTSSPVLLNALCVKYDDGNRLPRDAYELYSSIVDRVLYSRYRDKTNEVEAVRRRLSAVAFGMHTGKALGQDRDVPLAEIGYDELDAILAEYAKLDPTSASGADDAASARDTLLSRSGLCQSTTYRRVGFYHLTFQEFLAGEHIARTRMSDLDGLRQLVLEHSSRAEWRQTLLFMFAALWERAEPALAIRCIEGLSWEGLSHIANRANLLWDCLELIRSKGSQVPDLETGFRKACTAVLEATLEPHERAELFDTVTHHGHRDNRPGVKLRRDGLPDIDWVVVPGGQIELSGTAGKKPVGSFYIARYPITNAQFQAFADAKDGYTRIDWWKDMPKDADEGPGEPRWPEPNCPRETVSWYEAIAYCRWLSSRLGYEVRLPDEWEWQHAATSGDPDNSYPWGPAWDASRCNTFECGFKRTTAVGLYPAGANKQGVLDLAGNVWEWCLNKYIRPSDKAVDEWNVSRVFLGGSWYLSQDSARAHYRSYGNPLSRYDLVGFRVVCVSPIR